MRLLHRLGSNIRLRDGEELAIERHGISTPAGLQCINELVGALTARARIDVVLRMLLIGPPDTEAEHRATARKNIEGRDALREINRAVVTRNENARADDDLLCPRGDSSEDLHRLQDRSIGLGHRETRSRGVTRCRIDRIEQVLLHEQRAEAEFLRGFRETTNGVAGSETAELGKGKTNAGHGYRPPPTVTTSPCMYGTSSLSSQAAVAATSSASA